MLTFHARPQLPSTLSFLNLGSAPRPALAPTELPLERQRGLLSPSPRRELVPLIPTHLPAPRLPSALRPFNSGPVTLTLRPESALDVGRRPALSPSLPGTPAPFILRGPPGTGSPASPHSTVAGYRPLPPTPPLSPSPRDRPPHLNAAAVQKAERCRLRPASRAQSPPGSRRP